MDKSWKYNNTLIKYKRMTEGTWRVVENNDDAKNLLGFFSKVVKGSDWTDYWDSDDKSKKNNPFSHLVLGSDRLYDDLDDFARNFPDSDVRPLVCDYIEDLIKELGPELDKKKIHLYQTIVDHAKANMSMDYYPQKSRKYSFN